MLKGEIRDGQILRVDYDPAKDQLTFTPAGVEAVMGAA